MIRNSVLDCGLPLLQFVRNFDIRAQNVNAEPDYKPQFPGPNEHRFLRFFGTSIATLSLIL